MKKAWKLLLPFFLIGLIFAPQTVKGDYGVIVGQVLSYDVIEADLGITLGIDTVDEEGYTIGGQEFSPGTAVNLNITEVDPVSVDFNLSSGVYSEIVIFQAADAGALVEYMFKPLYLIAGVSLNSWVQGTVEGYHEGIMWMPFLNVANETWFDWIDDVNELKANGTIALFSIDESYTFDVKYTNTTTDFVLEFYMSGNMNKVISDIDSQAQVNATFIHQYQFAYEKATGVMKGMRMEGSVDGLMNGTVMTIDYNYHTELAGYNLPDLDLGGATWPYPGFEIIIAAGALSVIATSVILVRKRK